jgi:hypothetical protein
MKYGTLLAFHSTVHGWHRNGSKQSEWQAVVSTENIQVIISNT